jgi:hypothetical protein
MFLSRKKRQDSIQILTKHFIPDILYYENETFNFSPDVSKQKSLQVVHIFLYRMKNGKIKARSYKDQIERF